MDVSVPGVHVCSIINKVDEGGVTGAQDSRALGGNLSSKLNSENFTAFRHFGPSKQPFCLTVVIDVAHGLKLKLHASWLIRCPSSPDMSLL
jgi:hypothetical protein